MSASQVVNIFQNIWWSYCWNIFETTQWIFSVSFWRLQCVENSVFSVYPTVKD